MSSSRIAHFISIYLLTQVRFSFTFDIQKKPESSPKKYEDRWRPPKSSEFGNYFKTIDIPKELQHESYYNYSSLRGLPSKQTSSKVTKSSLFALLVVTNILVLKELQYESPYNDTPPHAPSDKQTLHIQVKDSKGRSLWSQEMVAEKFYVRDHYKNKEYLEPLDEKTGLTRMIKSYMRKRASLSNSRANSPSNYKKVNNPSGYKKINVKKTKELLLKKDFYFDQAYCSFNNSSGYLKGIFDIYQKNENVVLLGLIKGFNETNAIYGISIFDEYEAKSFCHEPVYPFNPLETTHGKRSSEKRRLGNMGYIKSEAGKARVAIFDKLRGPESGITHIAGESIGIHECTKDNENENYDTIGKVIDCCLVKSAY